MADYTAVVDLPDHKLGDEWVGISSITPTVTGITKGNLSRVRMVLVSQSPSFRRPFVIDSQSPRDAAFVIDNAVTWACHIPPVESFLKLPGKWNWDMEFHHSNDVSPVTLYKGELTVHDDVAK